jgi:hypothetical protein
MELLFGSSLVERFATALQGLLDARKTAHPLAPEPTLKWQWFGGMIRFHTVWQDHEDWTDFHQFRCFVNAKTGDITQSRNKNPTPGEVLGNIHAPDLGMSSFTRYGNLRVPGVTGEDAEFCGDREYMKQVLAMFDMHRSWLPKMGEVKGLLRADSSGDVYPEIVDHMHSVERIGENQYIYRIQKISE